MKILHECERGRHQYATVQLEEQDLNKTDREILDELSDKFYCCVGGFPYIEKRDDEKHIIETNGVGWD